MNYYNYFTEIEEHFVRRRGKHLMVSPMDWSLIATWRDSGVPLHVAIRGIDIAMDGFFASRHKSRSKVSTLFYCHDSVMEEYARHLEAHLGEAPPAASGGSGAGEAAGCADDREGPATAEIAAFLESRLGEMRALLEKQSVMKEPPEGISRLIGRLEELLRSLGGSETYPASLERDLGILDHTLVDELKSMVPPEKSAAWEEEAHRELRVYRKRLDKETYGKILDNFLRGRIRQEFDIGELSLFHL